MAKTVLISGAGIAGPTLAYWLSAVGFEPTLIEKAPSLRSGGYVIDFWGHGYDLAERMALLPAIDRAGYRIGELRIVNDDGRKVAGFGTDVFRELTGGRYVTLPRSELSRLLFEKIERSTEVIFGTEIAGLEEDATGVSVRLSRGEDRHFDLVVGADGLHSRVRELAFGPQRRFERQLGYIVAAFETSGYRPRDDDAYLMYGQPGRMLGRVSLRDDRVLFLFVFTAAAQPFPTTQEAQKALIRERYAPAKWEVPAILSALDRADDIYFDRVSQIRMPNWSRGRVALVGDAAFCVSLLAGQGSALAMISAYVLAGELAKARGMHQAAFAAYEALLRNYIRSKQEAAERFAGAFAPRTRWGLAFRNLVIDAFAIPGLARWTIGRDITDRVALPDYLRDSASASASGTTSWL
jgi:2-polyprenyl-6-methoxyphenol hydroxylase-like FAD-dependent oxidoreductase